MKQGLSLCTTKLKDEAEFGEDELAVAQILLDLGTIISASESGRLKFTWGCKRRRSSLDADPPSSRAPSPSLQRACEEIDLRTLQVKAEDDERGCAAAAVTGSPDTPLSFSPSESDEKHRHSSKKHSKKRSREEYIEMIEELTQRKDSLTRAVENVKEYYNKLKAYNSELKSMKQEVLKSCPIEEESQMEIIKGGNVMNLGTDLPLQQQQQHYRITVLPHQQPFITDQYFQFPLGPITAQMYPSTSNGPGSVNPVGQPGLFDLNVPVEEEDFGVDPSQPLGKGLDLAAKRADYAKARRIRRGIIKIKSMRSAHGIKLPRPRLR